MIPKESDWVLSYDLRSISEKGKLDEPGAYSFMEDAREEVGNQDEDLKELLNAFFDDPLSLGVDLSQEILMFHYLKGEKSSPRDVGNMGITAGVWDRAQFKESLEKIFEVSGSEPEIKEEKGRSYIEIPNMVLIWDDSRILGLSKWAPGGGEEELLSQAQELFSLEKDDRLKESNENFQEFIEERKDISNWLDLGKLSEHFEKELQNVPGTWEDYTEMTFHSFLEFKDNEVELTHFGFGEATEDWGKLFRDGVDKKLLTHLPEESYLGFAGAFDPAACYEWAKEKSGEDLKKAEAEMKDEGVDLQELITSFGGDAVFTLSSFSSFERTYTTYEQVEVEKDPEEGKEKRFSSFRDMEKVEKTKDELLPEFTFAFSTRTSYFRDLIEEKFKPEMDSLEGTDNGFIVHSEDIPSVHFGWGNDLMMIGTDGETVKRLSKGGYSDASLADTDLGSIFASSSYAGRMVLDIEDYPDRFQEWVRKESGPFGENMLKKMTGVFRVLTVDQIEENGIRVAFELKEGKGNSLNLIMKQLDENYKEVMMAL